MMSCRANMIGNWKHVFVNAALMLLAFAGMIAAARGVPFGMRIVILTTLCSFGYTTFLRTRQAGYLQRLDERELATAGEGIGAGALVSLGLASIWCLLIATTDKGIWYPDAAMEWQALGFFLLGLMMQVKNLVVAVTTPPYDVEVDEVH
jgi:hypothetical protein